AAGLVGRRGAGGGRARGARARARGGGDGAPRRGRALSRRSGMEGLAMTLRMDAAMRTTIERHLEQAYPEEGCGVLIGSDREEARQVQSVVPLENRREDSRGNRYLIGPEQFLAADQSARAQGLDV